MLRVVAERVGVGRQGLLRRRWEGLGCASRPGSSGGEERRSFKEEEQDAEKRANLMSLGGLAVLAFAASYGAIPVFRRFCQNNGAGGWGSAAQPKDKERVERMKKVHKRLLRVQFTSDKQTALQWEFKPLQEEVWVHPGETALIFYTARNPTKKPVVGISTYTVLPFEAGIYFAKIQCFCFEEQMLQPGEQVDLPVFFYIDPDFVDDPSLDSVQTVTLSYTFFESKDGVGPPINPYQPEHRILSQPHASGLAKPQLLPS